MCADSLEAVIAEGERQCEAGRDSDTCVCEDCCPQPDVSFEELGVLATCLADEPGDCDGRLCDDAPAECGAP